LIKPIRPDPPFIADAYAFDFLNSIVTPTGTVIDWIENGEDLLSWLQKTQMIPIDVAQKFRQPEHQDGLDRIARQASVLREWFRNYILV